MSTMPPHTLLHSPSSASTIHAPCPAQTHAPPVPPVLGRRSSSTRPPAGRPNSHPRCPSVPWPWREGWPHRWSWRWGCTGPGHRRGRTPQPCRRSYRPCSRALGRWRYRSYSCWNSCTDHSGTRWTACWWWRWKGVENEEYDVSQSGLRNGFNDRI